MELLLKNKKVDLNYEILEKYEAGIVLQGFEVKVLKKKQGSFGDSYVTISGGEVWLKKLYLPPYQEKNTPAGYDKYRDRKLLLNKKEIRYLSEKIKEPGKTLVPLEIILNDKGKIKVIFALAKGLKKYDKREKIKEREMKREMARHIKNIR